MSASLSPLSDPSLASSPVGGLRELASGIDALYLSGRADLSTDLFDHLSNLRADAESLDCPVPFPMLGDEWMLEPRNFGKYKYRLSHPYGLVGVTPSKILPAVRVQPRAELLHGVGPSEVVQYFDRVGEFLAAGPVEWSLSRLDLFCDVQGWEIEGNDRSRFVCRATRRDLHEESEALTGFEFGRRTTKTVCARIYDKTLQVDKKGLDWWPRIWGERYDRGKQVLRVEVELGRQGLVEYGVHTPQDGLDAASVLWASTTNSWFSYRNPTEDETRSRWPVAAEWVAIQNATLRGAAIGINRIRRDQRSGDLRILTPPLIGYLANFAALVGTDDLDSTLGALRHTVNVDESRRGLPFITRVAQRSQERASK